MKNQDLYDEETQLLYAGDDVSVDGLQPESMPIYQTSAFILEDFEDQENNYNDGYVYSRVSNPNRISLAKSLSFMEKGENTLVCSSGLNAISTAVLSVVKKGDHILAAKSIYGETIHILNEILNDYGIKSTYVDFSDYDSIQDHIKDNTKLIYLEIASNPLLAVTDIRKITKIAKKKNVKVMVDNTFTTPFVINPLEHGADIVIHSLSKFLNGHFDMIGGSVTTNDKEIYKRGLMLQQFLGAGLDPKSCWLASRSLQTANLRIKKQMDNAFKVAEALENHPKVGKVYYPGLKSHPQHELSTELYKDGYGAILSFSLEEDINIIDNFFRELKIIRFVNTLGGVKTTICHPATSGHKDVSEEIRQELGVHDGIVRISCGIEEPKDLINDLLTSLDKI